MRTAGRPYHKNSQNSLHEMNEMLANADKFVGKTILAKLD